MIKSMTGFGRSRYEKDGRVYTIEMKSVNHKYCDVSIKIPRTLSYMEEAIRKYILENVSRGKIEVFISFENFSNKGVSVKFNMDLAKSYVEELNKMAKFTGIPNTCTAIDISKMPEIFSLEEDSEDDIIKQELMEAIKIAFDGFIEMRSIEGTKMVEDIKNRLLFIEQKVEEIKGYSKDLVLSYIEKLDARVKELMKTDVIDETRIAQEIVIFSDKSSIEEELTRLASHISQFKTMLTMDSPIGKKIDFLIQEMNRETNTIGSKANCLEITNRVIEIKTEIENIREQIQNIE